MKGRSVRASARLMALLFFALAIPANAGHSGTAIADLSPNCGPPGPALDVPEPNNPPLAPLLRQPFNGATVNFRTAGGRTFTWTFRDPDPGDTQSAYAFRRRVEIPESVDSFQGPSVAAVSDPQWWDASTNSWVSSEVFNAGTSSSLVFPNGSWTNKTTYFWTVANKDSKGAQGPYANEFTVYGNAPPNAPTLVSPADGEEREQDNRAFSWTFSDPDEPNPGDFQLDWAFRRTRPVGSGSVTEWWNKATELWQSTEVFNDGFDEESYTFPFNDGGGQPTWPFGSHSWTVATTDSDEARGPYATTRSVTYVVTGPFSVRESSEGSTATQSLATGESQSVAASEAFLGEEALALATVAEGEYELTVSGSHFRASDRVRIVFDSGGVEEEFFVTTDGAGSFMTTINPQLRPIGTYLVRLEGSDLQHVVTRKFFVPCPTLTLTPPVVRRGFVVTARGQGFIPNQPVVLDWEPGIGEGNVVADATGQFETRILIIPRDLLGSRKLRGLVASEPEFPVPEASTLVVPGPVQPADFIVRH